MSDADSLGWLTGLESDVETGLTATTDRLTDKLRGLRVKDPLAFDACAEHCSFNLR